VPLKYSQTCEYNGRVKEKLTTAQVILHPVRARIITALSDRALTPREIAAEMPEIPLGTVYRHINIILDGGLIRIVRERRVHGTVERQFALVEEAAYVNREQLTADDITGLVAALTGVVQSAFGRYTRHAALPPPDGEIAFVAKSLYLTRDEYAELRQTIIAYLQKTGRTPSADFERRFIGFFSVPDPDISRPADAL
jgi:DNA-binding transcriptional ArsR family regulator